MSRPNISAARSTTRAAADWPPFAPAWAERASIHGDAVTFERKWAIPAVVREVDPMPMLRIEQTWTTGEGARPAAPESAPRIVAGPGEVWVDWRAEEVASTLRQIADALDPQDGGQVAAA